LLLPVGEISIVISIISIGYNIYTQNYVMACIGIMTLFVSLGIGQYMLGLVFTKIGIDMAVLSTLVGATALLSALMAAFFCGYFAGKLLGLNDVESTLLGLLALGILILIIIFI
jgi:hypothetical protein